MARQFWNRTLGAVSLICVTSFSIAWAETQFTWNSALTGEQSWNVDGNWDQIGFPNDVTHVANLSVPLAVSLNVDLGNGITTLAGLKLGGTANAVSTHLQSDFGYVVFHNDDAAFNGGIPLITSSGVAGSNNSLTANVYLTEPLDFSAESTNNVRIDGLVYAEGAAPSIRSFMPAGLSARIDVLDITDPADPSNYRRFRLNDSPGSPTGMPNVGSQGVLELGAVTGYGELSIGVTNSQQPIPLGTVILSGRNSMDGWVQINRGNVVLAHNFSLGSYGVFGGQPNQGVGFNFISDDDAREVHALAEISQWFTIKGEHSLNWKNIVAQSNSRGWINLLPAGKAFTLHEGVYAVVDEDFERTFTFDGAGRTVVRGGLHDKYIFYEGPSENGLGHFRKTGTGTVHVLNSTSSYHGTTIVEAGILRFDSAGHLANSGAIVSTGGAIGVDSGVFSNSALMAKFDAADSGGVMLAPSESNMDLDFTAGLLAVAPNVSVAAPEEGITYTGAITPAGDNYRLGGGSGTLTLPNQNQLTGDRGVTVTNGGEVRLAATNDYTGPTIVSDYAFTSRTNQAIADTTSGISTQMYAPTTLTVSSLKSGGIASSIGTSSNDAENLVIQGSTLRMDGVTDKIQRLFTIGSRGATIETVGDTRAFFVNSGDLAVESAGADTTRMLTLSCESLVNRMDARVQDAVDGGSVGIAKVGSGMWELFGINTYSGRTHVFEGQLNINRIQSGTGTAIIEVGGTLGGVGKVGGDVIANGKVAPGRQFGTLGIGGNLILTNSGQMEINIGVTTGSSDRLEVDGNVELAGTLRAVLPSVGGPQLGDVFPFLTSNGNVSGAFDALDLPALEPGLDWQLQVGDTMLSLRVVAALAGDYNFNGVVDAADYTVWRDSLGQMGTGLAADGDNNQIIDELDYAVWKDHFGETLSGSGSDFVQESAVPEPTGLLLAALAIAGKLGFRRHRRNAI